METQRRGADGRRLFSAEFKREQVARVLRKEITFAELSRELGIDQSVVRRWQHLVDRGSRTAVAANEDVVPASELRAAQQRIRELERALGKKTMEVEILQAARDEGKKQATLVRRVQAMTGRKIAPICHDRACLAWCAVSRDLSARDIQQLMHAAVARRFGVGQRPDAPIEFLSDNRSIYTALDRICTAERWHLEPITTPKASPQSNGMSQAFVNTRKRDYVSGADRSEAAALLDQVAPWIDDYNAIAPHSALGYRSPWQYRAEVLELVQLVSPICLTNRGAQQLAEGRPEPDGTREFGCDSRKVLG